MKIIVIISILSSFLLAQNPSVYSALGDVIYDNSENIKELKNLPAYKDSIGKIQAYLQDVKNTKAYGFDVQNEKNGADKIKYLSKLRELSKTNDFFVRSIKNNFEASINDENNTLFLEMVENSMLDSQKYKNDILDYYFAHSDDINATKTIRKFLDEDKSKAKRAVYIKSKNKRQEEKIKRIRENDRIKQERIKKTLEEEVAKKKQEIKEEQMKKLNN
jgi:hypothetical protein